MSVVDVMKSPDAGRTGTGFRAVWAVTGRFRVGATVVFRRATPSVFHRDLPAFPQRAGNSRGRSSSKDDS
ncbi:Uncharacterised protein [Mycobacteroides abscessus subsp. abscessus]|nr:Uncharacterised protein [Mycobacteroides abscessus subsp. abscessus]